MNNSRNNFTSSTSIKPSSQFHVVTSNQFAVLEEKNENESSEETRNDKEQQHLPMLTGSNSSGSPVFDSQNDDNSSSLFDSSLPPYDPVTNYLSPRPKFLMYNPDRHREILSRQIELTRIIRKIDHSVEKTEEIVEEFVGKSEEHEEKFDEFGDDDKWSMKVFLKYLLVMLVLILITLSISSMNSSPLSHGEFIYGFNFSEVEQETLSPVMLMAGQLNDREIDKGYKKRDQNDLTVSTKELVAMRHEQTTNVCEDEVGDLETVETDEKISNQWLEPVILISEKIETYRVDPNSSDVNEESEILKATVDEDDSDKILNENEIKGKENTNSVTKLAYFDPFFAAFSAIAVIIFASTSVLYYSMQTESCSPIGHINEVFDESSSVGSFGSKSSIFAQYYESNKDASSSNQTKYFDFQQSTSGSSSSHGSFTIEKKILKKQRNRTPEVMISTVRRSSRIHNRSISSP